jgi:hypothetical protein
VIAGYRRASVIRGCIAELMIGCIAEFVRLQHLRQSCDYKINSRVVIKGYLVELCFAGCEVELVCLRDFQ